MTALRPAVAVARWLAWAAVIVLLSPLILAVGVLVLGAELLAMAAGLAWSLFTPRRGR